MGIVALKLNYHKYFKSSFRKAIFLENLIKAKLNAWITHC